MDLREAFQRYKVCVVRITVELPNGTLSTGSGFHIGKGYLVTARHVVEGNIIQEVVGEGFYQSAKVKRIIYPENSRIDLAILESDFSLEFYMTKTKLCGASWEKTDVIEVGGHLDDWIGDEFVLSKALLMGFPRVPLSRFPVVVAVAAEVNAVVDRYDVPYPYFVISSVSRGGFSGGPVISEWGFLLGVLVHSLYEGDQRSELGFAAAISVEPLLNLIYESKIDCGENSTGAKWLLEGGDLDNYPGPEED